MAWGYRAELISKSSMPRPLEFKVEPGYKMGADLFEAWVGGLAREAYEKPDGNGHPGKLDCRSLSSENVLPEFHGYAATTGIAVSPTRTLSHTLSLSLPTSLTPIITQPRISPLARSREQQ